jgi:hypothetical protein
VTRIHRQPAQQAGQHARSGQLPGHGPGMACHPGMRLRITVVMIISSVSVPEFA